MNRSTTALRQVLTAVALTLPLLAGCGAKADTDAETERPAATQEVPEGAPRLVLFVVVDQMRADYLERFRPLFEGGLKRLLDEATVFTEAHQDHAATETAPGHATLATGSFPAHNGIVGNYWFDRERGRRVYSVGDDQDGVSPRNLMRPTLGDLMKKAWPSSKVFAIGGKDRSATLTAGAEADAAYWYSRGDGTFTTSTYYYDSGDEAGDDETDETPDYGRDWIGAFHDRKLLDAHFGTAQEPTVSTDDRATYGIEPLDFGAFTTGFPYALGSLEMTPGPSFYSSIYSSPLLDRYVVDFAEALIEGEDLGQDEVPDFLGVALSALDSVGHSYGPDSPETLEAILNVDRVLGELLRFVDERIGLDRVALILSSDHGVGEVPEMRLAKDLDAGRFGTAQILCFQRVGIALTERFGLEGTDWMPYPLYLDREALAERQVDADELIDALATELTRCPRVERAFLGRDLTEETMARDDLEGSFARSNHPERSSDLDLVLTENTLISPASTVIASHGQPHDYDSHVPWLLLAPGVPGGQVSTPVRTVDVAPTLAELLGLQVAVFDGSSRLEMARRAASADDGGWTPETPDE